MEAFLLSLLCAGFSPGSNEQQACLNGGRALFLQTGLHQDFITSEKNIERYAKNKIDKRTAIIVGFASAVQKYQGLPIIYPGPYKGSTTAVLGSDKIQVLYFYTF